MSDVFFMGREVLDPKDFSEYLYPHSTQLATTSESQLAYHGPDYHIPGFPANPRMLMPRLYIQLGTYLDYYTGEHDPSLSLTLRNAATQGSSSEHLARRVPQTALPLFPHFNVSPSWPPTFLVHGSADTAVPVQESQTMAGLLREVGVDVELRVLHGLEHAFDAASAEECFGQLFDDAGDFLVNNLKV
jgi:acetyl esterase/lipase